MGPASALGEAATPLLSRGARECLRVIEWYRKRGWKFSQAKLAQTLKVTERQVQRYYAELQAADQIAVARGRRTVAEVAVVGGAKTVESPESRPDKMSGLMSGLDSKWSPGNSPPLSDLQTEMSGLNAPSLFSSPRLKERDPSRSVETTPAPRRIKYPTFPQAEGAAVQRAVENCGVEANAVLFRKLATKAEFYGVSGFVVAAHILRAWRRIERQPANHPRGPGWITTAVENELATASGMRSGEPKSPAGKEQWGGGSPERAPLAAAAGQEDNSRTSADLPGTPPPLTAVDAQARQEPPRKLPEASGSLHDQIEHLAARKAIGRSRGS